MGSPARRSNGTWTSGATAPCPTEASASASSAPWPGSAGRSTCGSASRFRGCCIGFIRETNGRTDDGRTTGIRKAGRKGKQEEEVTGSRRLPRAVGVQDAQEMLLFGRKEDRVESRGQGAQEDLGLQQGIRSRVPVPEVMAAEDPANPGLELRHPHLLERGLDRFGVPGRGAALIDPDRIDVEVPR